MLVQNLVVYRVCGVSEGERLVFLGGRRKVGKRVQFLWVDGRGYGAEPPHRVLVKAVSYTHSDAADDLLCVDLGGRRIIKKKKKKKKEKKKKGQRMRR